MTEVPEDGGHGKEAKTSVQFLKGWSPGNVHDKRVQVFRVRVGGKIKESQLTSKKSVIKFSEKESFRQRLETGPTPKTIWF